MPIFCIDKSIKGFRTYWTILHFFPNSSWLVDSWWFVANDDDKMNQKLKWAERRCVDNVLYGNAYRVGTLASWSDFNHQITWAAKHARIGNKVYCMQFGGHSSLQDMFCQFVTSIAIYVVVAGCCLSVVHLPFCLRDDLNWMNPTIVR